MIRFAIISLVLLSCASCGQDSSPEIDESSESPVLASETRETQATSVNVFYGCKSHD